MAKSISRARHSLLAFVFHLAVFLADLYFFNWVYFHVPHAKDHPFGRLTKFTFLTNIGHLVHLVLFGLSTIESAQEVLLRRVPAGEKTLIDTLFGVSFVLSTIIGILFWALFFYNRELILPVAFESVYPASLNLYQHGVVAVLVWIKMILWRHEYDTQRQHEVRRMGIICGGYVAMTVVVFFASGSHIYPFMKEFSTSFLALFYFVAFLVALGVNELGRWMNRQLWRTSSLTRTIDRKKKK
eukprot:GILK01002521.1.p1 GENE.GILK01002521.1~~GILK01002521.1.p1  ORF type:complete len:260 (-),score=40.67 GILK01002521.1:167-889(-)